MVPIRQMALLCAAALLSACGVLGKKPEDVPGATLPTRVGRIVMVDAAHRFALLDAGTARNLAPRAELIALRDRKTAATLVLTAESRPPFLAAEITSGMPVVGDSVFLDESLPPEEDDPPGTADAPAEVWLEDFPEE